MPYDPIRLLRQSWSSPDDLARELFVLFTEGVKLLPTQPLSAEPGPTARVPARPARLVTPVLPPRPASRVTNRFIPTTNEAVPVRPALPPPEESRIVPAPELPRPPARLEPAVAPVLPPPAEPPAQAPGVAFGLPLTQFSFDAFPGAPAPLLPQATGPLPAIALPVASAPEPGTPVALRTESVSLPAFPPGLRSIPPAEPAPAPVEARAQSQQRAPGSLLAFAPVLQERIPTGTREIPALEPAGPALETEQVRLSDEALWPIEDVPEGQTTATPVPYTVNPYPQPVTALLEVNEDGVPGFKNPVSTGDGEGVPGKGKAYVLDYDGDHLTRVDSDPMDVVTMGAAVAPGLMARGVRIWERFWWVETGCDVFFADFLNIAASPGALSGLPALNSTTGDVYAIVRGAWKKIATSARIYNGLNDATDNTMRQILGSNGDGTFTVKGQGCTAP